MRGNRVSSLLSVWAGLGLGVLSTSAQGRVAELAGPAEPPAATQPAAAGGYWLRVVADEVDLRSRPDANSPAVARLERGALLRAEGSEFGWHRVLPPEGVFSYVAAEYIDRRGADEGVVSVREGNLRVRVGSLVHELDPQRSEVQCLLPRGARVRILGAQGEWLKIAAPEAVRLHVAERYVERISDEQAGQVPAGARAGAATAGAATRPAEPDLSGPWGQRLRMVEAAIEAQAARPVLEQAWAEALARLRPIAVQREEPAVARLAEAWIARLEQRIAEQDGLRAAEEVLRRAERDRARHERELERIEHLRRRAATQPAFAALGELRESVALAGRSGPPAYQLLDPPTGRVEVYLEPAPGSAVDLARWVGKYVGVRGPRRADAELGADVLRVEELVVLEPDGPATRPATR